MRRSLPILVWLIVLLPTCGHAQDKNSARVELSLRLVDEQGASRLEILVQNIGTDTVVVTSEGIVPEWSPWAWFDWTVDCRAAEYIENVAGIPGHRASRSIPPGGNVIWAQIPLSGLWSKAQKHSQRAITDDLPHTVVILPSDRWKGITVKPGKLIVKQRPNQPPLRMPVGGTPAAASSFEATEARGAPVAPPPGGAGR